MVTPASPRIPALQSLVMPTSLWHRPRSLIAIIFQNYTLLFRTDVL